VLVQSNGIGFHAAGGNHALVCEAGDLQKHGIYNYKIIMGWQTL
jgi:hypothetical protein